MVCRWPRWSGRHAGERTEQRKDRTTIPVSRRLTLRELSNAPSACSSPSAMNNTTTPATSQSRYMPNRRRAPAPPLERRVIEFLARKSHEHREREQHESEDDGHREDAVLELHRFWQAEAVLEHREPVGAAAQHQAGGRGGKHRARTDRAPRLRAAAARLSSTHTPRQDADGCPAGCRKNRREAKHPRRLQRTWKRGPEQRATNRAGQERRQNQNRNRCCVQYVRRQ